MERWIRLSTATEELTVQESKRIRHQDNWVMPLLCWAMAYVLGGITHKKWMLCRNYSGLSSKYIPWKAVCGARNLTSGKNPFAPLSQFSHNQYGGDGMCSRTGTAALPIFGTRPTIDRKSLLCFVGRTATYPSQCQSQIVCPVNLFVGREPLKGLDSDCSNIYPRSHRPVRKEDTIRQAGQVLSHWTSQLGGQHL